MLAPTAFRAKVYGTKYGEANYPETEVWRACQRSIIGVKRAVGLLLHGDVRARLLMGLAKF